MSGKSAFPPFPHLQAREIMAQEAPDDPRYKQIPPCYCSMRVFDDAEKEMVTGSFGFLTSLYKVVDVTDGMSYALRRVERVRTNNEMVVSRLRRVLNERRWF